MTISPSFAKHVCCQATPNALVRQGIALFNRGQYFECHEALEDAWRMEKSPCRALYQAILQLGAALYHVQNGNKKGAQKLLARAASKFKCLPECCQGINVRQLQHQCQVLAETLARNGPAGVRDFLHIPLSDSNVPQRIRK